jgi:hypothetical protein
VTTTTFHPTFDADVSRAAKFDTPADALTARSIMAHQLGGNEKYKVHELRDDGSLQQIEP